MCAAPVVHADDELADIRNMLESLLPLTGTPAAASGAAGDAVGVEPLPPAPGGGGDNDRGSKA